MKSVQSHSQKTLVPQPITDGARMWSAAFMQNCTVTAVDASSPDMEKYKQGKNFYVTLEIELIIAGCPGMKP